MRQDLFDVFMQGPEGIEIFHGYTYSGHPLACAAGIATLDTYEEEGLLTRASRPRAVLGAGDPLAEGRAARHRHPQPRPDGRDRARAARRPAGQARLRGVREGVRGGVLIRVTGDIIALSPPLIVERTHIDRIVKCVGDMLRTTGTCAERAKGKGIKKVELRRFLIRFVAYLVDSLIVTIGFVGVMLLVGVMGLELAGAEVIFLVFAILYWALMHSFKRQATIGKSLCGLKVGGPNGERISVGRALGREAAKIVRRPSC